jgi:hypothetical protein
LLVGALMFLHQEEEKVNNEKSLKQKDLLDFSFSKKYLTFFWRDFNLDARVSLCAKRGESKFFVE